MNSLLSSLLPSRPFLSCPPHLRKFHSHPLKTMSRSNSTISYKEVTFFTFFISSLQQLSPYPVILTVEKNNLPYQAIGAPLCLQIVNELAFLFFISNKYNFLVFLRFFVWLVLLPHTLTLFYLGFWGSKLFHVLSTFLSSIYTGPLRAPSPFSIKVLMFL